MCLRKKVVSGEKYLMTIAPTEFIIWTCIYFVDVCAEFAAIQPEFKMEEITFWHVKMANMDKLSELLPGAAGRFNRIQFVDVNEFNNCRAPQPI